MKRLYKLLIVLVLVLVLTGCKKANKVNYAGTYNVIEITQGETTIRKDMLETLGIKYKVVLKDDKTFDMDLQAAGVTTGTYDDTKMYYKTKDDDGNEENVETEYTIADNKLSLTQQEVTMIFEKE